MWKVEIYRFPYRSMDLPDAVTFSVYSNLKWNKNKEWKKEFEQMQLSERRKTIDVVVLLPNCGFFQSFSTRVSLDSLMFEFLFPSIFNYYHHYFLFVRSRWQHNRLGCWFACLPACLFACLLICLFNWVFAKIPENSFRAH